MTGLQVIALRMLLIREFQGSKMNRETFYHAPLFVIFVSRCNCVAVLQTYTSNGALIVNGVLKKRRGKLL